MSVSYLKKAHSDDIVSMFVRVYTWLILSSCGHWSHHGWDTEPTLFYSFYRVTPNNKQLQVWGGEMNKDFRRDRKGRGHKLTQQLEGWGGVNPEIEWLDRVKKEQGGERYSAQWTTAACFYMTVTMHQVLKIDQPCKDSCLLRRILCIFNVIIF